jgi:hypothetical protein
LDEADLDMVNDLSDVLLDLVCHILLKISVLMFLKENGLLFSFLELSLSSSGMSVILASQNELGNVPSLSILWKNLRRVSISSSLKV